MAKDEGLENRPRKTLVNRLWFGLLIAFFAWFILGGCFLYLGIRWKGRVRAAAPPEGAFTAAFRGGVEIADFAAVDRVTKSDFLGWRSLRVSGADVALGPFKADVGEIALADFHARLILSAQGRLNLQDVLRAQGGEALSVTDTEARRERPAAPGPEASAGQAGTDDIANNRPLPKWWILKDLPL